MSNNYWIDRFTAEENRINELSKEQVKEAKKEYDIALKNINQKIYEFYAKYAKDNNISMYEAKQRFNKKELKEFKMSLSEYVRKGKSLNMSSDNSIIKELKNVSSRVHIERLEALKMEIKAEIDLLSKTVENNLDKHLREVYKDSYYRSAYSIQKGLDKFSNIEKLNPELLESLVYKPWTKDNTNWSKRIWGNDGKLVNTLHTNLTQNIITGKPLKEVINTIAERFNVEKNIASRLIMTESAAYHSKAKERCMKDLGCGKYEVIATLDDRTSSICRSMDGKVFDMKDYQVGVTASPFHANCRTVTAPYYDKIDGDTNLRASRTEDDDYDLVDVKDYQDWYDNYVEKNNKSSIIKENIPLTLEKFNEHSKKWKSEVIDKMLTEDEQNLIRKKIKNVEENSAFLMRYKREDLENLTKTNKFMNLFETGTSSGVPNTNARMIASKNLFGHNLDKESFVSSEKYGYLSSKNFLKDIEFFSKRHGTSQYGDIIISFNKGKVKDRITYTLDDSLLAGATKAVVPGDFKDNLSLGIDKYNLKKYYEVLKDLSENNDAISLTKEIKKENGFFRYIELQYHGDITLDDVNEICFSKDLPKEDIIKILKDKNIKLFRLEDEKIVEIF
ncbi:minor capsid protein [Fusobacterium polymorphum]|nr:minor capsid protein [Fusobacterium polymorphum]